MNRWSLLGISPVLLVFIAPTQGQEFVNWETPHVSPLTLTPDGTRLLAVNLPDNRLEVFGVTTGTPTPTMSIPVGLDPVSVRCRNDNEAWVVNHISDTVSIVDLTTGHVVATLPTDDEPADVVFAGTPQRAYVSCSQTSTVLVFDPASLATAPVRIPILGEEPRAMGVSPSGDEVYVAVFESGNRSTIARGGPGLQGPQPVDRPDGPYGGVNPPPNAGAVFNPALNVLLPTPPGVSLILKQNDAGLWLDDNGADWTLFISGAAAAASGRNTGWTLLDHDVAVIATSDLSVTYVDHLMNLCMALGVNPVSGEVTVVGTDATNEIRFEPLLTGTFLRTDLALVDPGSPGTPSIVDLNSHLDYSTPTVPQATRDMTLADPRGIVWNSTGSRAYVTGMGSNNVVVIDAGGARVGTTPTIVVGEGPTGLVLEETHNRLYVLNKFEASISVIDTDTELELSRVPFFDPTPAAVTMGRSQLYDAHETSGLGLTACASCHVDARTDRLAWDLGNPAGFMAPVAGNNLGGNSGFEDFHPMKGPMLTTTLQDIIGKEPHHWRGDRAGLEGFHGTFFALQGDDAPRSATEMQQLEDFLATIYFPPNPYREFDNSLSTDLPLPGHFTTSEFGPEGLPLPNGNAANGAVLFTPSGFSCSQCHTRPTGLGTGLDSNLEEIPIGPNGELHHRLINGLGSGTTTLKIPQLRNLYERTGSNFTVLENTAGFGFDHDGTRNSVEGALDSFPLQNNQQVADLVAFLLSFSGDTDPMGSLTDPQQPLGTASQSTHAAVGAQLTLPGAPDASQLALLDAMTLEADQGDVGLVAKGRFGGVPRGWAYLGGDVFQSDQESMTHTRTELLAFAGVGTEFTFTVVPFGSQIRIGVDRNLDGIFDWDDSNPVPPVAGFSGAPLSGGAPLIVAFTNASTGTVASWAWDFGDGGTSTQRDPSHTYTTPGTYDVSLTATGPVGEDTLTQFGFVVVDSPVPPLAAFTGTPLSGGAPLLVDFSDASTGTVTSWLWDFGDGGTSTEQNPSYTYTAPGTYTVSLTATGPAGADTLTQVDLIDVSGSGPVASFTATPLTGDVPLTVQFRMQMREQIAAGVVTGGFYDFGDGTEDHGHPNVAHSYTTPGTYTVSFTVNGPGGTNTMTRVDLITVSDPAAPVAGFSGMPLAGEAPLAVDFADASTGTVTSWAWNFGDGGTSTAQNPSHTYAVPGTYTVSLSISGPSGVDTSIEADYVVVDAPVPPVAAFSGAPLSGAVPLNVDFTDASTGTVTSWDWDFGDGATSTSPSPSHNYTTPGTYTVSLTASGPAGADTLTEVDYVVVDPPAPPVAAFSGTPLSGEAPLMVGFSDASTGSITSWSWDFGDGGASTTPSPSHTYTTAGTYTVSLTVMGPTGDDTQTEVDFVVVDPATPPVAGFGATPLSGNSPLLVDFSDTSTGSISTWSWDFGDGGTSPAQNPSHSYAAEGTYTVSLTVTGPGGADTLTQVGLIDVIDNGPVAGFTATPLTGDVPLTVQFRMQMREQIAAGVVTGGFYDFGDGTEDHGHPNVAHTYTTPGTYTVSFTVSGPGGTNTMTRVDLITVSDPAAPVAGFSGMPLAGEAPLAVDFADASTGTVTSWAWNFGDGGTSTAQNPSHTYTVPGTYSVSLTISGPSGGDTLTEVNYVVVDAPVPPAAAFSGSPLSGGVPLNVDFTDASTGTITSWDWDFGDGGASTAPSPSHNYATPGTYTVSLTVTGPAGADTLTEVDYVVVDAPVPPVAAFTGTPLSGEVPLIVGFSDASTGLITSWSWNFGDGGTSTTPSPSHTYATAGTYTVSLTVTGPAGADTLTEVDYVVVDAPVPPVAAFTGTPLSGEVPLIVGFSDASTGLITSWSWNFGDGGTSTTPSPSHTYATAGTYTVSLTVTGPAGADTLTEVDYVVVDAPVPPVAAFTGTPLSGEVPLIVGFSDASTGLITSWSWNFGDGGTSTTPSPSHTYATAGTYTVSLTVTGPAGGDTLTQVDYVVVNAPVPPVAGFGATPLSGNSPLLVDFSDASTGSITSWLWDFGDGGTSTTQNPSHFYTAAGTYTVTLTVTGPGGADTLTQVDLIDVIDSGPFAGFTATPLTGDAPLTVEFRMQMREQIGAGVVTSGFYDFGDGTQDHGHANTSHTYTTPGTYTVSFTVSGPGGTDTMTRVDYITVN